MTYFFLHGLESGPHGSKYRALVDAFGTDNVIAPDFRGVNDVAERLRMAEDATEGLTGLVLLGSSFGGLIACLLASKHPSRVSALILAAPAFHLGNWTEQIENVPDKTVIVHGTEDDVVPVTQSQAFAEKHGVRLAEVAGDHRLQDYKDLLIKLAADFA